MRTTLVIDDELMVSAKKLAAERGCSVSAVVVDALRGLLDKEEGGGLRVPFRLPVFGGENGRPVDTPVRDFQALAEDGERDPFRP